jgi:hypothetical protein
VVRQSAGGTSKSRFLDCRVGVGCVGSTPSWCTRLTCVLRDEAERLPGPGASPRAEKGHMPRARARSCFRAR